MKNGWFHDGAPLSKGMRLRETADHEDYPPQIAVHFPSSAHNAVTAKPESMYPETTHSSQRDHQEASTFQSACQDIGTLVLL
jgi:hypothetical protein